MFRHSFVLLIFFLTVLMAGCQKTKNLPLENPYHFMAEEASLELTKAQKEMVVECNNFGFNVANELKADPSYQSHSFVFSPLSAAILLGMTEEGAVGKTAEEISRVLGFGSQGKEQINNFCRDMMVIADNTQDATVRLANAIMVNKGHELKDSYLKVSREYYDAECATLDFSLSSSLDYINNWASEKTNGLIPQLLDELNDSAVAYLMNALYFKAGWNNPFERTKAGVNFAKEDGLIEKVEMMYQMGSFSYSESELAQRLTLPYLNGAYTMAVILPRKGRTVAEVISLWGSDEWKELAGSMRRETVKVSFPSFSTEVHIEFLPILRALGMESFSSGDFSNISVGVYFNSIFQKAKINVDQIGTEAAAVTVADMEESGSGAEEQDPVLFEANRPFLYMICEKTTGAILFIGAFMGD